MSSLLPFLYIEPAWVPGLPLELIGTERRLASNWGLFIGVIHSRLTRIRSTLITMDSNSRLTRDMKLKQINQEICDELKRITEHVTRSFNLMATYIESPYLTNSGWKGNISLKNDFIKEITTLKKSIEVFSILLTKKIIEIINEKRTLYDVSTQLPDDYPFDEMLRNGENFQDDHSFKEQKNKKPVPYRNRGSVFIRDRVGISLDYYHRLYPNKTFCNLAIQVCLQTISFHREVIDFIESIENDDIITADGYHSVNEKDLENDKSTPDGMKHDQSNDRDNDIMKRNFELSERISVLNSVDNPMLGADYV